jgi:hypothetical protein
MNRRVTIIVEDLDTETPATVVILGNGTKTIATVPAQGAAAAAAAAARDPLSTRTVPLTPARPAG